MFKSILCLNGNLPDRETILGLRKNNPLIAADGAANHLIKNNIKPNIIIGDLDSLDTNLDLKNINILKVSDQNHTDFEKSLKYTIQRKLFPILVLGINGGEIDHIIDNMNKFIKYSTNIPMIFFDSPNKWGVAISKNIEIKTKQSSTISIFPFEHNTHLKSTGLNWELDSNNHTIFQNPSTRNKNTSTNVSISSSKDKVLVIIENDSVPFIIK